MLLEGKTAVITGCNRGIGLSILKKFSENNCNIIACNKTNNNEEFITVCDELKKKHNIFIKNIQLDLSNHEQVKDVTNTILLKEENIDILVNNAGINQTSLIQMTSIKKVKEIFDVNFFSPYLLTQSILKKMIKNKKGSIINISSSAVRDCPPGRVAYAAAKSSLEKFSETLSKECGLFNVRSNVISPGLIQTDMLNSSMNENEKNTIINNISLRKLGVPSNVSDLALFLASDNSDYITGQILNIDGGLSI